MSTVYIAVLTYVRPIEEIDAQLPEHVEWLKRGYSDGTLPASGRLVPRTGGVILARGAGREAVEARLREDPLHRLGLATVEVIEFEPRTVGALSGVL